MSGGDTTDGTTAIQRVGVLGGGQMGGGIAEVCVRAGMDVVVREIDAPAVGRAQAGIEASLDRATEKGMLEAADAAAALARLRCTDDWDALADRQLVIEAVIEDETVKRESFARLDAVVADDRAVLATNTSSLPISRIAAATTRPGSVIGMHFFNPVPVLPLVELVPSLRTDARTRAVAEHVVAEQLGKSPIWCTDRAGFVVNALLIPYLLAAIRMYADGVASAEDIDTGMVAGCAHPMGPLRLADLIGLDTIHAVAESLFDEYRQALYAPPPLLSRMVEAGLLGRKSGRGFYRYAQDSRSGR